MPVWPLSAGKDKPGCAPGGAGFALCRCHQLRGTPPAQPSIHGSSTDNIADISIHLQACGGPGFAYRPSGEVLLSWRSRVWVMEAVPQTQGSSSLPPSWGQDHSQGWDGAGWEVHPPSQNFSMSWRKCMLREYPLGEQIPSLQWSILSDPRVRLIHTKVASVPYPSCCWQRYVFCSCIICLQSRITLTKSKEEIYLLYFAFRQLCPGTVASILIDYTAIFLNFSSKYDAVSHLNHLSRNPLQRPYHSNFSHILCLRVRVWYFILISSPTRCNKPVFLNKNHSQSQT